MTNAEDDVTFFGDKGNRQAKVKKGFDNYLVQFFENNSLIGSYMCESEIHAEQVASNFAFNGNRPQLLNG